MKITARRVFDISVFLFGLLICADILYFGYLGYLEHEASGRGGQKLGHISGSPGGLLNNPKLLVLLFHCVLFTFILVQIACFLKARYYSLKSIPISFMDLITHRYFLRCSIFVLGVVALISVGLGVAYCDPFLIFQRELRKLAEWAFWGLVLGLPFIIFLTCYNAEKKRLVDKIGIRGFYNTGYAVSNTNFLITPFIYLFTVTALAFWSYSVIFIGARVCRFLQ